MGVGQLSASKHTRNILRAQIIPRPKTKRLPNCIIQKCELCVLCLPRHTRRVYLFDKINIITTHSHGWQIRSTATQTADFPEMIGIKLKTGLRPKRKTFLTSSIPYIGLELATSSVNHDRVSSLIDR